jgi:hypothetical protein
MFVIDTVFLSNSPRKSSSSQAMTVSAVLVLAVAVFTCLSVVPDVPVSAAVTLPDVSDVSILPLILLQEETKVFAVDFSPVPVLVATPQRYARRYSRCCPSCYSRRYSRRS